MQALNEIMATMKMIEIKWEILEKMPLKIEYYFNGKKIGHDDAAVEKIINLIKGDTKAEGISFTGRSTCSDTSGLSLVATLPFHNYWDSLSAAIGQRKIKLVIT